MRSAAIELLPQEFRLLEYLMRNAGSVVTRSMLLEHVWGIHFDLQTSVVESRMSRLRTKLSGGSGRDSEYIRTIRGSGYMFVVQPASSGVGPPPTFRIIQIFAC